MLKRSRHLVCAALCLALAVTCSPQAPVAAAAGPAKGRATFLANACVGCHTIKGTDATGDVGPELTHLASKDSIAGTLSPVNAANLTKWIKNPPGVKPGTQMPNLGLSDQTIADIVSYLVTLK